MDKIVGIVTKEELSEIEEIFERKISLENLTKIIKPHENEELYQQMIKDYGKITQRFNIWWTEKSSKYEWERNEKEWYVDFETGDIYLKE